VYEAEKEESFRVVWNGKSEKITVAELLNIADPPDTRRPPKTAERPDPTDEPVRVFISYAHRNEEHMDFLRAHLKLAERQRLITVWHDRLLRDGEHWNPQILDELNKADIIVLLVTAQFFASDYIYDHELRIARERETAGTAKVLPLLVEECDWESSPIAQFQMVNRGKAVIDTEHPSRAWTGLAKSVRTAAEEIRKKRQK